MICENIRSPTIALETLKMRAFPFTLQGAAQDWWYYLSLRITNWATMEIIFLKKYFPVSRVQSFVEKFMELSNKKEKPLVNIGKDSTNSVHLVLSIKCKSIPSFNTFMKE